MTKRKNSEVRHVDSETEPSSASDIQLYIADLSDQLSQMASANGLNLVAALLTLAKCEATRGIV